MGDMETIWTDKGGKIRGEDIHHIIDRLNQTETRSKKNEEMLKDIKNRLERIEKLLERKEKWKEKKTL